ncbi:MAG: hypothetical protein RJA70_162 [Pseudomonadota bacterium]|jgi:poly-gamma-glutamate biosynthesis protein PgsC/CapC
MEELLTLSIGIGLAVSVLLSETFGVAAGGMIVPGYLALSLTRPLELLMTFAAAFLTYGVVRGVSAFMIVYGRRRTVLMILSGYLIGGLLSRFAPDINSGLGDLHVVGFIIPGLIAIWLDRQGVVETLASAITAASLVRLVLVLTVGSELLQ